MRKIIVRKDGTLTLCSFTPDKVSQLDQDVSTALATIREWKNSFAPINRIPLDVLSLIPTHLSSQKDRFRATSVCHHWRRTFIQHAALWSQLDLSKGEVCVKALLERAGGSPLDITSYNPPPTGVITLLSPHTKQIRSLNFVNNRLEDIQQFAEPDCGPLPLLRTLVIDDIIYNRSDATIPPSLINAVNLQEFRWRSMSPPFFNHFVFPNLTSFDLSVPRVELHASQLLDFLNASPTLQVVRVRIFGKISLDGVPRKKLVVLPNVESLCLVVSGGEPGYDLATHISCPVVKRTSLTYGGNANDPALHNTFPPASWNAIVRQYTRSPIEEVTLVIDTTERNILIFHLVFQSPDETIIRLCFEASRNDHTWNKNTTDLPHEIYYKLFSQASRAIRGLPQLANVKRLHIRHVPPVSGCIRVTPIANEVGRIFKFLPGPLEILTLHHCEMQPYFTPSVVFPPIEELTILHPFYALPGSPSDTFEAAMVGLAESQYALGVPFGHVTVRMDNPPAGMAEGLRPWVGARDCYNERCGAKHYTQRCAGDYSYSCAETCMCTPIIPRLA